VQGITSESSGIFLPEGIHQFCAQVFTRKAHTLITSFNGQEIVSTAIYMEVNTMQKEKY
jgi:hypothetical protein